jgi:uncharacterized protein YggE
MQSIRKHIPLGLGLLLAGCSLSAQPAMPRMLTVTGTGTVERPPDLATISLVVQTTSDSVEAAVGENNRRTGAVLKAVSDLGVDPADVQTAYFSLTPQYQYDDRGQPTGGVTYWVVTNLTVRLRQVDQLGDLLKASLDAGSTGVGGVSFGLANSSQDVLKARQLAIADAQRRAAALAEMAGAQLGDVRSIDTVANGPIPYVVGLGGGAGIPVASGQTQVQQSVVMVVELR